MGKKINENIKFSCLMSVYKNDKPEYVALAIDSILNQTLKPNQYVIVVDGPISNELKELLLDYEKKDEIIELHFRDKNLGLGLTLNEGLGYCKYEYVARMDADDYSLPDRFEKQMEHLMNDKTIDVLSSFIDEYDDLMVNKISTRKVPELDEDIKKYMKFRNPINHVTAVYRKSKVLEVNSYEDYPYFEDYYLWAKLARNNAKFYNIQKNLVNVRGGNSMYERRGGKKYITCIKKFEEGILALGIINKREYRKNLIKRYIGALLPNWVRGILYKLILRGNR
ncbi:MAG: glycosyltransferase [Clostridia bacterium]|nr:glycosyltransferase [Clostridia bacterium]